MNPILARYLAASSSANTRRSATSSWNSSRTTTLGAGSEGRVPPWGRSAGRSVRSSTPTSSRSEPSARTSTSGIQTRASRQALPPPRVVCRARRGPHGHPRDTFRGGYGEPEDRARRLRPGLLFATANGAAGRLPRGPTDLLRKASVWPGASSAREEDRRDGRRRLLVLGATPWPPSSSRSSGRERRSFGSTPRHEPSLAGPGEGSPTLAPGRNGPRRPVVRPEGQANESGARGRNRLAPTAHWLTGPRLREMPEVFSTVSVSNAAWPTL